MKILDYFKMLVSDLYESYHGNKRVMIIAMSRTDGSLIDVLGPGTFSSVMASKFGDTPELRSKFMEKLSRGVEGKNGSRSFEWDENLMMVVIPTYMLNKS